MESHAHLTIEGLDEIRRIKAGTAYAVQVESKKLLVAKGES